MSGLGEELRKTVEQSIARCPVFVPVRELHRALEPLDSGALTDRGFSAEILLRFGQGLIPRDRADDGASVREVRDQHPCGKTDVTLLDGRVPCVIERPN